MYDKGVQSGKIDGFDVVGSDEERFQLVYGVAMDSAEDSKNA